MTVIDPGVQQTKHRIGQVGTIGVAADGTSVDIGEWEFRHVVNDASWIPPDMMRFPELEVDGRIAGWAPWELHDVAHGWPCGCGVDKVLRDAGFDFPYKRGPL